MQEAKAMSNMLLENKLVACANYHAITSDYIWKGELVSDNEIAVSFKTLISLEAEVRKAIETQHSYDVPLIGSTEMIVSMSYFEWMQEVCKCD